MHNHRNKTPSSPNFFLISLKQHMQVLSRRSLFVPVVPVPSTYARSSSTKVHWSNPEVNSDVKKISFYTMFDSWNKSTLKLYFTLFLSNMSEFKCSKKNLNYYAVKTQCTKRASSKLMQWNHQFFFYFNALVTLLISK